MTEQERAAVLADEMFRQFIDERGASNVECVFDTFSFEILIKALRLLAATPAALSEVRELPHAEFDITGETDARKIGAPKVRGPYVDVRGLCSSIESRDGEVRERVAKASKTHALIRTSPKGEMFLGTCTLCGTPNLSMRAAIEPCPNQLGLSQDEALIDILAATTDDPDQEYDDRDMAEVGRALMAAIETYASTDNPDDPLFRWHPAQCPSEIVGDLIEMVNQARATAVLRTPASDGDREILWRVEKAMIAADRDPEKEVNYAGLARAALSAIRPGDRLPAGADGSGRADAQVRHG